VSTGRLSLTAQGERLYKLRAHGEPWIGLRELALELGMRARELADIEWGRVQVSEEMVERIAATIRRMRTGKENGE
jgi:hypothetical protein